jgi:hypothetical protein
MYPLYVTHSLLGKRPKNEISVCRPQVREKSGWFIIGHFFLFAATLLTAVQARVGAASENTLYYLMTSAAR